MTASLSKSQLNFPTDLISSTTSICLGASHQVKEHVEPTNNPAPLAKDTRSAEQNGNLTLGDEWEGEVVEEVLDQGILKFRVAWVPTLEPGENLSIEMRAAWEKKKAESKANRQRNGGKIQSKVESSGIRKRRGQPRKDDL